MVGKKAMHALNILVVVAGVPYGATVSTQAVAKALQLSVSYLEGLIKTLRDHQLIRSFRVLAVATRWSKIHLTSVSGM